MENEILNFISRRWNKDAHWLDGNCLWFALILHKRFPQLEIAYLPIQGHFIVTDGINCYDWTGRLSFDEQFYLLADIQKTDPLWYSHLMRDCFY